MGRAQAGERPRFALEACLDAGPVVAQHLAADQLDRRRAGQQAVPSSPDLAHAAATDALFELVAAELPRSLEQGLDPALGARLRAPHSVDTEGNRRRAQD